MSTAPTHLTMFGACNCLLHRHHPVMCVSTDCYECGFLQTLDMIGKVARSVTTNHSS
ncbi:hypothetical protein GBAR_LOCUS30898, partial [Geodia barretti]